MNNKGFTLLEVMGVLLLLVVILMVTIPNITNTIKKSNLDQLEKYEETVCLGAKTYILENKIEVSGDVNISGALLVSENYLADSLVNPDTKKNVIHDSVIVKYNANHALVCNLVK